MIVLDASVIIPFLRPSHSHHDRAVALFSTMYGNYLFVPALNWAEVLVGAINIGKVGEVEDRIQRKLGVAVANPDGADWPMQLAQMRARTKLKMPDAFVLATAEALSEEVGRVKVATFDKKLAAAAASEGLLYEPPMARSPDGVTT